MAKHLSLTEFNTQYPGKTITDYVKFNWLGISYGPEPEPVPEFEDFITAEYYANQTTRLDDLITNIDVEGIRPPAFMDYSHSTYPLGGQTPYLNGRFEQTDHPIEDRGFNVEFTLQEPTKVTVEVGSASNSVKADVAVINTNNQFIPAVSYSTAVEVISSGLYSVPSTPNQTINYELPAGTYRLGSPSQTTTQRVRIFGIYKTPVPVNPLSRDFTKQEVFDEFDTAYRNNITATNPYTEDTFYRRSQAMTYGLRDQGLYMIGSDDDDKNRAGIIKSFDLATSGKYRVDIDLKAWVQEGHGSITASQSIMSIFLNNNDNTDYFGFILMYDVDGTYYLDTQYRDAINKKVSHRQVLTGIDASQFIKYSVVLDFDNKVINSYVNDTLLETSTDNPKMESFGGIGIPGTNNNILKLYSPTILKSITVTEVE